MPEALRQVALHGGWIQGLDQPTAGAVVEPKRLAVIIALASSRCKSGASRERSSCCKRFSGGHSHLGHLHPQPIPPSTRRLR